jgi:outer membrane protein assembly factor BamB
MVIGSKTNGQGQLLVYQVPIPREGGIWSPPGPAIDANGHLYVAVGNGEVTSGTWDHTDSVLRLSPTLQLEDGFAPTQWAQDNAADADLGSMSPVLLPNGLVFSVGKSGRGYLLHANALGGVGGQIQEQQVCPSYGGYATVGSQIFLPCRNGIRQVKIEGNNITMGWQRDQPNGSPVVGGHTVYCMDYAGGTLYALNSADGSVRTSLSIGTTSRFATPTLWNGLVFVGTMQGVVALKVA